MKWWTASLALALAFVVAGCAEVEMRGVVRDRDTGEPLPGATVRVGDRSTSTDLTGFYDLDVDESDEPKEVFVHKPGYEAFVENVDIDDDRADEMYLDFELRPSSEASSRSGTPMIPEEEQQERRD